jgi:hypothetical protein
VTADDNLNKLTQSVISLSLSGFQPFFPYDQYDKRYPVFGNTKEQTPKYVFLSIPSQRQG